MARTAHQIWKYGAEKKQFQFGALWENSLVPCFTAWIKRHRASWRHRPKLNSTQKFIWKHSQKGIFWKHRSFVLSFLAVFTFWCGGCLCYRTAWVFAWPWWKLAGRYGAGSSVFLTHQTGEPPELKSPSI